MKRKWMQEVFISRSPEINRTKVLVWAGILIAGIALLDWHFEENISFEFLYLFPLVMVGRCLTRPQIAAVAALCTGLGEAFDPFPWVMPLGISRLILSFVALFGTGLYVFESARRLRLVQEHLGEIEKESEVRRSTEEQLEFLISSSPATIFTLDTTGRVIFANAAAHRLFGVEDGKLQGQMITEFIPALTSVPQLPVSEGPMFHAEMECRGRRQDGEVFLAHVGFSTYRTMSGPRLAAVVFDASEELRDRAEFNLQQILTGSKVLVGALCHEIRNLCGAITVIHTKLMRGKSAPMLNEDFRTLGTLVEGLEKMAGMELRQTTQATAESIDIRSVLEELRIVIEPWFHESGTSIHWDVPNYLPRVWADRHALLQAFLNIAKNSQQAMEGQIQKDLTVGGSVEGDAVAVRFTDNGPGVSNPEQLFKPFQPGAQVCGLGLFLSRTFVRAFQGDIKYEPQSQGCSFAVFLRNASSVHGDQPKEVA